MKKPRIYAGNELPDELRLAAVNLLDAVAIWFEQQNGGKEVDISTAEMIGMSTIVLNEVNREVTYGLWKDGDIK